MPATFRTADQDSNTYARYPVKVLPKVTTFTSADTTNTKLVTTSETTVLGTRVDLIVITSNDTASNVMEFFINDGTTTSTLPFAYIAVPFSSGTDQTTTQVSVLRSTNWDSIVSLDNNGNPYLMLGPGWSLHARLTLTATATKTIQVVTWSHDY